MIYDLHLFWQRQVVSNSFWHLIKKPYHNICHPTKTHFAQTVLAEFLFLLPIHAHVADIFCSCQLSLVYSTFD